MNVPATIAFVLALFAGSVAAEPVLLGTFDGDVYAYESDVVHDDNVVFVWVVATSQRFNHAGDPNYAGIAAQFAIDCSGHNSMFIQVMTFDAVGKAIRYSPNPEAEKKFFSIKKDTIEDALYSELCVLRTAI